MPHKLFPSQQPNEKIMLVVREHWFLLGLKFAVIGILMLLPVGVGILLKSFGVTFDSELVTTITAVAAQLYYLGLLIALFNIWVIYYLNVHIVSDQRIVDIDQMGLLFREVSELNIETIEDVTSQNMRIFGNFLDYGNVYIQTAGAAQRFEFGNIPHPSRVAGLILQLYEAHSNKSKQEIKP